MSVSAKVRVVSRRGVPALSPASFSSRVGADGVWLLKVGASLASVTVTVRVRSSSAASMLASVTPMTSLKVGSLGVETALSAS